MKTKDLLLVASGVAIGYLIFKKDLFKKVEKATKDVVASATQDTAELVNPRQAECEQKWIEYSSTIRPNSQETLDKMKAEFMNSCLIG
jgi:hypothetical protein